MITRLCEGFAKKRKTVYSQPLFCTSIAAVLYQKFFTAS